MSTETYKFGLLVRQHIFVIEAIPPNMPGGIPMRLIKQCEFILNIDTDEVIKNRWEGVESEAALARVVSLFDERISDITDVQDFLNISLWP